MNTIAESTSLYVKHEAVLKQAIEAVHSRKFFSHYPEPPSGKIYGETANEEGKAAFENQLGKPFSALLQKSESQLKSGEISPYTLASLGITYPVSEVPEYITRSKNASSAWKKASPQVRTGILIECLDKIRNRFFEIAFATMHTTGQPFVMSFQASGPHSNDRALEAIALGYFEQTRFPSEVDWVKPMGKIEVSLRKSYKIVPKGINLLIACSTFPVWNTFPGLFAGLVTGNTAIVKPHPMAIYPLAIVVAEIQKVLLENGFDPHIVQLAADSPDKQITKTLAEHPDVKLIDFTGGSVFGDYIEGLSGKTTFTEKAGINSTVIESVKDIQVVAGNIAFSLSLYSGQMCTCPQNIFIPEKGISAGSETLSYEDVVQALANAVKGLVSNEKMGPGTLGAIQSEATYSRVKDAQALGYKVICDSMQISNPEFPKARIASPAIIEVPVNRREVYGKEMFGPIVFVIPVKDAKEGVQLAKEIARTLGAITFSAYTTRPDLQEYIVDEISDSYTSVSFNFTGPIWVNQSAGFSDFHVTGGNPAGNASLTDPEFITRRFEFVGVRIQD